MSKKTSTIVSAFLLIMAITLTGCASNKPITEMQTIASVKRGDLEVKVEAYGYIETPDAVNLYFDTTMFTPPYSARIENIYVEKGDVVKAGALLAKLDDTAQKMAAESAQYALELAINNVVQTVCCGVTRAPSSYSYSDSIALLRFEFATKEAQKALSLLADGRFEESASEITLAKYDIDAAKTGYIDPQFRNLRTEFNGLNQPVISSQDVDTAIDRLTAEIDSLSAIQEQIKDGSYDQAAKMLRALLMEMPNTQAVIKRTTHSPSGYTYPDTCTTLTVINEALTELEELSKMTGEKDFDAIQLSETLRLAMHDLELGDKILQENVSTFRQGLNLKAERDYNINVHTALINLERTKQALLKTELIAPFDGEVVDVNLHEGDMITQRYSVTGLPIDTYVLKLADTSAARMTGTLNEIDAGKVSKGQKAKVLVDAFPGKVFNGEVKFISPYGTLQTGTATYNVEIALDPNDATYLTGGLTATAEILVDSHKDVLLIPNSALHLQEAESWVYVVKDDKSGLIEQRQVQVGLQSQTQSEILSGLNEGEEVLLKTSNMPAKSLNSAK
jgi:RND family efflux transporter MFP subunit